MLRTTRLVAAIWLAVAAGAAAADIETVALEGETAPAGDVFTLLGFDPALGEGGEVLYGGWTTTSTSAVFRGVPGSSVELLRAGDPAPDGNGSFSSVSHVAIAPSGASVVEGFLTGTSGGSSDDRGIFFHPAGAGALERVVREGQSDPEGNGVFGTPTATSAQIGGGDVVGIRSLLTGTSGGSNDNVGLYFWEAGVLTRMVRDGQSLPGGLTARDPRLFDVDDLGSSAISNSLAAGTSSDTALFTNVGGTLAMIAREGDYVDEPVRYGDFRLRQPDRNDAGDVAFWVDLIGTGSSADNQGVFLISGGATTELLRKGSTTPDGLDTLTQFNDVLLGDGVVLAYSHLASGEVGLYWMRPGDPVIEVLRTGTPSPDGDGTITNLVAGDTAMGPDGTFAAEVVIGGSATVDADGPAIVLGDDDELHVIVRGGTPLEGSTVDDVRFKGWMIASQTGFNGRGQVAFQATLADGREGIFLYTPSVHWVAGSGLWGVAPNWSSSVLPGPPHAVYVDAAGPFTVTGPSVPTAVASLDVGSASGGRADLVLTGGGSLAVAGTLTVTATGALSGVDPVTGDVDNGGVVAPGTSPGILAVDGDYEQLAGGRLEIDLEGVAAGSGHDRLEVTGTAALAGTLALTLGGGFVPQGGDYFDVLTAETITGTFDATELPALGVGLSWVVSYDTGVGTDSVRLTVDGGGPGGAGAVPDGHLVPGAPLSVGKAGGGDVELSWSGSCASGDDDFAIYEGELGVFTGHTPVTCSTAGSTSATITPAAGNRFFLVVPRTASEEGSYGFLGDGGERPPSPSACVAQVLATCD